MNERLSGAEREGVYALTLALASLAVNFALQPETYPVFMAWAKAADIQGEGVPGSREEHMLLARMLYRLASAATMDGWITQPNTEKE